MANTPDPEPMIAKLRSQALGMTRVGLGLPAGHEATEPYGLLMEMGMEQGAVTVVALGDGSASLYFSTGGGTIGGGDHPHIHKAAQDWLALAVAFQRQGTWAAEYPLPGDGMTFFYFLTDAGVFQASAPTNELGEKRHPLWVLFYTGQDVLTGFRMLQESKG